MAQNPFHHLYAGEKVNPEEFVRIFSHKLVDHASLLFQSGHVILSGIQGSGKSMLYKLFDPAVRIAYSDAGHEFPIPKEHSNFIGAGINVNTSRCNEFGNRKINSDENIKELLFADFFNYLVSYDIIKSVITLGNHARTADDLNINLSEKRQRNFVESVSQSPVWEGYLKNINTICDLSNRIRQREILYRRFLNYNDRELDPSIASSKTSVGEPMKAIVNSLKESEIVDAGTEFFILVDQYEELATIKDQDGNADYRSIVNKCISRDRSLSYRIGTRGYAWRNHLDVFGSEGHLEEDRDYKLVELDTKLRAKEFSGTSIFPEFANDVFTRRLQFGASAGSAREKARKISDALGTSMSPREKSKQLAGESPASVVKEDNSWPSQLIDELRDLAQIDPLSAKLGEVWYRQKGVQEGDHLKFSAKPWAEKSRQYWRKERSELALLRIAGIRKQRFIYCGEKDILGLSGYNILVFLSLCQYIWDYASQASSSESGEPELPIQPSIQTIGVFQTAKTWLDRIPSDYGRSDDRFKLIQLLGEHFSRSLHHDAKMSNPGQNGISLSIEDLRQNSDIHKFLVEAVDYGNLTMVEHTTRNKDRKRRLKFYLNPLYCPIYRIPYQHTKEPLYISAKTLEEWLAEAGILERLEPAVHRRQARGEQVPPLLSLMNQSDDS